MKETESERERERERERHTFLRREKIRKRGRMKFS